MEGILSRCGYRCDLCLAYRPNVESNPANSQKLSDGWYQYFGFRIPAEKVICNGCLAENSVQIDQACPVRPCVIEKGLENCAACESYACEKLAERLVVFAEVQNRLGRAIPDEDRISFIQPYENKSRLEALRASRDERSG
jgi:hypothetical protein